MERAVINALNRALEENIPCALVLLTETDGSSPGRDGSMMLVYQDRKIVGTIGGGSLEYDVIDRVIKNMGNENFAFEYNLGKSGDLGMICGGSTKGYVRYFVKKDTLYVFGAGHVGGALVKTMDNTGFHMVVIDDREAYLNRPCFDHAERVLCPFKDLSKRVLNDPDGYYVIMTPNHEFDYEVLSQVMDGENRYVGLMGSASKVISVKERLRTDLKPNEKIEQIFMPIGLNIGKGTPEEIAISIGAEILAVRSNKKVCHLSKKTKED